MEYDSRYVITYGENPLFLNELLLRFRWNDAPYAQQTIRRAFTDDLRFAMTFSSSEEAEAFIANKLGANLARNSSIRATRLDAAKRLVTQTELHRNNLSNDVDVMSLQRNKLAGDILCSLVRDDVNLMSPTGMSHHVNEELCDMAIKYANVMVKKLVQSKYWYNDTFGYAPEPLPKEKIKYASGGKLEETTED